MQLNHRGSRATTRSLERARGLRESGVLAQADLDKAVADFTQGQARITELKATIDRKTIRAPFSGVLGIRQANLGQYLAAGDKIVSLESHDPIYVNFSIPQQELGRVRPGVAVRVKAQGASGPAALRVGKVTAIDSVVDEATRNVQVQATLRIPTAVSDPGCSCSPYRGVQQQFVKLGASRGDQVAVVSGLKAGQEVVTSGVFKLRTGAAVEVNNKVQPGNDPSPKPQDS